MRAALLLALVITIVAGSSGAGADGARAPIAPFETDGELTAVNRIDEIVFARLDRLDIRPSRLCSDAVFVRRAYLDVIGTLPTVEEVKAFLDDAAPDKRSRLIDSLLARDEFADYWATKWCDALRVKAEFPVNLWPNAVQAYHRWVRESIRDNKPYDRFARELLTSSGSNFRVAPVNFYRSMQSKEPRAIAHAVALAFMGSRAEKWPEDKQAQLDVFFSRIRFKSTAEWKEEIVFFDPLETEGAASAAVFPDGTTVTLKPDADPRLVFADWLIRGDNPWFARGAANRVWFWLMGRGIVHEPDDFRPDNPASNPELLGYLARELVDHRYDLRHLYRLILNSRTYQLSCIPACDDPRAAMQFAHYHARRLDAEVLIDAVCQITGSTEEYSSMIPEPFTFIPEDQRAIELADGSVTSPFLELFGRPSRDTGLASERNNEPTASQKLHLLNSSHIRQKIERSAALRGLRRWSDEPKKAVDAVYLTILSRYPTDREVEAVKAYAKRDGIREQDVAIDLAWALINSGEFLYRH